MARTRINPTWIKEMKDAIVKGDFEPRVISYNTAAQWLITYLASKGYTPKVEQLGAGVKRISIVGTCCPTCGRKE